MKEGSIGSNSIRPTNAIALQANKDQANKDQANNDQANNDQANNDQANNDQASYEKIVGASQAGLSLSR